MIDTVVIAVPRGNITARDVDAKGRSMWEVHKRGKGFETFYRGPSMEERESDHYFPRITGVNSRSKKHGVLSRIKMEFSIPKLLYGNNVDEVSDADFDDVLSILQSRLCMMGLDLTVETLRSAAVVRVDYSKNIPLGKRGPIAGVLKELEKSMVRRGVDVSNTHYRNGGQSIMAVATEHSFLFYDKVAELSKKKKGGSKKWLPPEAKLAARLRKQNILRFEVRLSVRKKLSAVFTRLGFGANPIFSDVFSSEKSLAVLRDYWQGATTSGRAVVFGRKTSAKEVLHKVLATQPKLKAVKAIELAGLILLARDGGGMRELRTILGARVTVRTWQRVDRIFKNAVSRFRGLKADLWFQKVEGALKKYKPFRSAVYYTGRV